LKRDAVPTIFDSQSRLKKRPANDVTENYAPEAVSVICAPVVSSHSDHLYHKRMNQSCNAESVAVTCPEKVVPLHSDHSYVKTTTLITNSDHDLITKLKQKVRHLTQQLQMQRKTHNQLVANLSRFLNPDQIRRLKLKPKSARHLRWSNHTVKTCLQLRYATGKKGYSHLRKLGYPVPAYRTLCDRVVKAEFRPGLQSDVFEWLRIKTMSQPDSFSDCSLALDEMQLHPCIEYDKGEHF